MRGNGEVAATPAAEAIETFSTASAMMRLIVAATPAAEAIETSESVLQDEKTRTPTMLPSWATVAATPAAEAIETRELQP